MSNTDRDWLRILTVIVLVVVVIHLISFFYFPLLPWMEQRKAGEKVVKNQIDAEKAIKNYEWFRTQWHDIKAQRAQIQNHYQEHQQFHDTYGDDPSNWSRTAEKRHGRIHTRLTGAKNHLENLVAEYNARSSMENKAMWKCHLPYQVDERFAITGPPGTDGPEKPNDQYVDGANPNKTPPSAENCDGLTTRVTTTTAAP